MPDKLLIQKALHAPNRSQKDVILLLMYLDDSRHFTSKEIAHFGEINGLSRIKKWNISSVLINANHLVMKYADGWALSPNGKEHIATLLGDSTTTKPAAIALRKELNKITSLETRLFLDEAISCLEHNLKRAAVVLSWVGAVSVLYNHVIANHLAAFNAEASRRDIKWRTANTSNDLARMKEADFLDILVAISIIDKNVKEHLKNTCLNLRNSCGHPNSLKLGKHTVEAHIETLILNIFQKF